MKPSFAFEFKEIQFVLKIGWIPSFAALTQLDVYRISEKACGGVSFGAKQIIGRFSVAYVCAKLFLARVEPSQKTSGLCAVPAVF